MKTLSIVTTVYNRANLIHVLYDSLCRQTCMDFIWIIVDDGSSDNIGEVVRGFDNEFPIVFFRKKNAGKCSALNYAIKQCSTELFFVVDSDDFLKTDAVEQIIMLWKELKKKKNIIGIVAYRSFKNGNLSGKEFPLDRKYILMNELNYKYKHHGETALIYRTDLLKQHMFPEYKKEKFLSEEIIYNELDKAGYLYILRKCLVVMEYLEDGLTANYFKNWIENPKGTKKLMESKYRHILGLGVKNIMEKRIKTSIQYDVLCICSKKFRLTDAPGKIFSFFFYPLAVFMKKYYFKIGEDI